MIEIVPRNGPPEALTCPAVVCDVCRRQITDSGNILWAHKVVGDSGEPPAQSPMYAAHKGNCDMAMEKWLKVQYGQGWITLWEEADTFLQQLVHNFTRAFGEDTRGDYQRLIIQHPKSDPHREIPDLPVSR